MIKADGVQRSLVGEIIGRFERSGLKLIAIKMFVPDHERAEKHYGKDDAWCMKTGQRLMDGLVEKGGTPTKTALEYGRDIVTQLLSYITAGPVVAMVFEGNQAVGIVKKLVGGTEPLTSDVGTIRGDFTLDSYAIANMDGRSVRNLIHCTGDISEAEFEINLWFKPEEIIEYRHVNEAMLYDTDISCVC